MMKRSRFGIRPQLDVTKNFFDKKKVIRKVDEKRRANLQQIGYLIRRTARQSMRKKKNPSKPGTPPRRVRGDVAKRTYFSYDKRSRSVVVGPAKYQGSDALEQIERGGTQIVRRQWKNPRRRDGSVKKTAWAIKTEARPFMHPALMKNMDKIPKVWKNSIGGGGR